jgi:hypothetical protein
VSGLTWYASPVHAIAIALTLSFSLILSTAPPADVPVEPSDPEPLPDIAPEPEAEPTPEPELTPEPEPTPEPSPEPVPPPGDDRALAESTTTAPSPVQRDRLGCDGSRSCRRMSIAGIVVGSLGLIAIGSGIGLLVRPDEVVAEQPIFVKTSHPPGLVAVTIGTGVVLTSALMLGAAHKGYKQRPNETARVQLGPTGLRF